MATNQCEKMSSWDLDEEANKENNMASPLTPIDCPIGDCNRTQVVSQMLAHYVRDHALDFGMRFKRTYMGKKMTLDIDPELLAGEKNMCLGVLAYGGLAEDKSSRPAARGLSVANSMLPEQYARFEGHLPVFIMACRTSLKTLLKSDADETSDNTADNPKQNLIILWLAGLPTQVPIYCSVILYNRSRKFSRGMNMKLRPLNRSQKPKDFVFIETNSMRLSSDEIDILSDTGTSDIRMKIIFNEHNQIK